MDNRRAIEALQKLTEKEHLKHIRRILHFNFWCDEERLYFLWMYDKLIIDKMHWDDLQSNYAVHFERFFEVITFDDLQGQRSIDL